MDLFKQSMKGPTRPAPSIPGPVQRYSPVTNWNDDPFGADVFEPAPQYAQKKKPPPRPPPPKVPTKQPELSLKPSNFIRRPTVLSTLLSRKNKSSANAQICQVNSPQLINEFNSELETHKMFPKCEPKNIQTGALIDLSSPPSSPTFTTRSSSDGLSVDSFGSDATTSTNHHNVFSGGNASQAESGFEDDFDLFLSSRKNLTKDDTLDDFASVDPFCPQLQTVIKPPIMKKPELSKDLFDVTSTSIGQTAIPPLKGPTIIRGKPARPKPPDNSALLKNTFGGSFPVASMNINTTAPIHKICNGFDVNFDSQPSLWEDEGDGDGCLEREWSPPMPSVPPPPPPPQDIEVDTEAWPVRAPVETQGFIPPLDDDEPYAIALFDYFTEHPDDLCFSRGSKIKLVRRVDDEWLYGKLRSGAEGLFPANYVEVKVGLPNEGAPAPPRLGRATVQYDFAAEQPGDLPLRAGDTLTVMYKLNDEWYFGECNGLTGQFPANYVQMS